MKCHEAKRHLDLFMDGELSVSENMKVLEHLNLCAPCARAYEGEKALRAALREKLGDVRAPDALRERLSRALEGAGAARRPFWGRLAAAAFFVAVVGVLIFTPPVRLPQLVAADLVQRHDLTRGGYPCASKEPDCLCVCPGCTPASAEQKMMDFFRRRDRGEFCPHDLGAMGFRYQGAAVWEHRGRKASWSIYRAPQGRTISHALMYSPIALGGRPLETRSDGRVVLYFPRSETLTCVFVFDNEEDARRFREMMGPK